MIASPCINVCRMDEATGLCAGCCRTLEEIAAWSAATDDTKRRILRAVQERQRDISAGGSTRRAAPQDSTDS